jgi:hypothetical protein
MGEYKAKMRVLAGKNGIKESKKMPPTKKSSCNITFVVAELTLLGYSF